MHELKCYRYYMDELKCYRYFETWQSLIQTSLLTLRDKFRKFVDRPQKKNTKNLIVNIWKFQTHCWKNDKFTQFSEWIDIEKWCETKSCWKVLKMDMCWNSKFLFSLLFKHYIGWKVENVLSLRIHHEISCWNVVYFLKYLIISNNIKVIK